MKTILQLRKSTSSLQSMIMMNNSEINTPKVGMFLTRFLHTDRSSQKIVKVDGNNFYTENGNEYTYTKSGKIKINWSEIQFININNDFSNYKEEHKKYVLAGGTYFNNFVAETEIEGITKKVNKYSYLNDYRITKNDLTHRDPSF